MQNQDIKDVLELQVLFSDHGFDTAGRDAKVLAALIDWKSSNGAAPAPAPAAKAAPAKAPRSHAARGQRKQSAPPAAEPPPDEDTDF